MDQPQTILITGGSRGIGAATAKLAATRGYNVGLTYRSGDDEAARVCSFVQDQGRQAMSIKVDLSQERDIRSLWEAVLAAFGNVDALVNNAAILEQQMCLAEFDPARLRRLFDVNVIGTMLCTREAVRHMATSAGGSGGAIVNVSSMASRFGSPHEYIDYAASKAAIDTMTIGLAKEVGPEGIRVNAVRPGTVHTDIHASGGEPERPARIAPLVPLGRCGQADEIANAIIWLLSDEASYVNGAILDVAGGL